MKCLKSHKSFEGITAFWEMHSHSTNSLMKLSTFTPGNPIESCLIWLSGLTCNEENFITKSGIQKILKDSNTMVICPDTSPRNITGCEAGESASYYLNATTPIFEKNYQMENFIALDLIDMAKSHFNVHHFSIIGHSMGGHGALMIGLKYFHIFKSISAFAPVVNPSQTVNGKKILARFLGENPTEWKKNDANELILAGHKHPNPILISQGSKDEYLGLGIKPDVFKHSCDQEQQPVNLKYHEGYDHSYYFVASFLKEHIDFHLNYINT